MPVVIPFADCIARPDAGEKRFRLDEHLEAVAFGCGRPAGAPEDRLAFLAGLLHDAAKAAPEWQEYIRGKLLKGPPHAPLGAALFAYWADDLIPHWAAADRMLKRRLFDLALDWVEVVYDHHGGLDDLGADPPWRTGYGGISLKSLFATLEHTALTAFVRRFFPEAAELAGFSTWLHRFDDTWRRRWQFERDGLLREAKRTRPGDDVPLAPEGLGLAKLGAILVFADRAHAADWKTEHFARADAERASATFEVFLQKVRRERR